MRVLLDSRMIHKSGIGRYIQMLASAMIKAYPELYFLLAGERSQNSYFIGQQGAEDRQRLETIDYDAPIYSVAEQVQGSRIVDSRTGVDLVHVPNFNAPWHLPRHSVVTIHDIIPFKRARPRNHLQIAAGRLVLKNTLKKAGRVIVISQATADDLLQDYPQLQLEEKMRVIPQGVAPFFTPLPQQLVADFKVRHHLHRYILSVGNRASHKNLDRLLLAYAMLIQEMPDLQMVIVGKRLKALDQVDIIKHKLGLTKLQEWTQCSDEELRLLYCGAEMLVFPSLYEGFGLTPLEAMACGTAVVVSGVASIPEVVATAGLYINPLEATDIAEKISLLINDANLKATLRDKGLKQAALFTWQKTAARTMAVYQEVAAAKGV